MEKRLYFAVVLHMHQPKYNLTGPTYESDTAREVFGQTLHPYTYPADILKKHENARVTMNFTGSLIEQLNELLDVGFDSRLEGLWGRYREAEKLGRASFTGCGYFHPIFPLIPEQDRRRHVEKHLGIFEKTFGGKPAGFWPPELAFSMKIIPDLADAGLKWAVVDGPHVLNANREMGRYDLMYRPHYAEWDGKRIIVIPRDRDISNAQQSGYNPVWLKNEIEQRIQPHNEGDFLLTVATDGENGWFRHSGENAGFWGWFFEPLLYLLEKDPDFKFIKLTTIDDYLDEHPPRDTIVVEDGSWNVPEASDDGRFLKWTGGEERQRTWAHILETSRILHEVAEKIKADGNDEEAKAAVQQALEWLLLAESSDNFWWGSKDWLNRSMVCSFRAREKIEKLAKQLGFT
jgi:alpha-amylase/alpha-mannosidase (GH57 family)